MAESREICRGDKLASLLQRQGKLAEATEMQRRLLKLRVDTLGPEHPDTLSSSDCLASMLRDKHPYEAHQLLKAALEPLGTAPRCVGSESGRGASNSGTRASRRCMP